MLRICDFLRFFLILLQSSQQLHHTPGAPDDLRAWTESTPHGLSILWTSVMNMCKRV